MREIKMNETVIPEFERFIVEQQDLHGNLSVYRFPNNFGILVEATPQYNVYRFNILKVLFTEDTHLTGETPLKSDRTFKLPDYTADYKSVSRATCVEIMREVFNYPEIEV